MVRTHVVEPDPARGARLDERYHRWRDFYATLRTWTL
jgi:sugar (pentulose or hexulose) kinase